MNSAIWKRIALFEALCIAVLLAFGAWQLSEVRKQTRISTLRAFHDHLAVADNEKGGDVGLCILDLRYNNNELAYKLNNQPMHAEELRDGMRQTYKTSPLDPVGIRFTGNIPFTKIASTLRLLTDSGGKIFFLFSDNTEIALTDRNITPQE
jgi:hypothetical protein